MRVPREAGDEVRDEQRGADHEAVAEGAVATCDHPNAPSASHASRDGHRGAWRYPAAPTRAIAVQAIAPANGIEIAISEVDISIASDSPPAVAASLDSRSIRRNANSPSPAIVGFATMNARIAAAGDNCENSVIGRR